MEHAHRVEQVAIKPPIGLQTARQGGTTGPSGVPRHRDYIGLRGGAVLSDYTDGDVVFSDPQVDELRRRARGQREKQHLGARYIVR